MKKILKFLLAIMLVSNMISFTVLAEPSGNEFNEYGVKKEVKLGSNIKSNSDWNYFAEKSEVPLNKEWTITFSDEVTKDKIDGMVIEKDNKFIPVEVELTGQKQATVTPVKPYEANSNYTLKIFLNNGKRYKMYFNTKSESSEYTDEKYFTFDKAKGEIIKYREDAPKDVIIPKTIEGVDVISIGDKAFNSIKPHLLDGAKISISTIPQGVYDFPKNKLNVNLVSNSLTSVIIPDGVINIGHSAFTGNQLTTISIPNSVSTIESYAFYGNKLETVQIPKNIRKIQDYAFYDNQLTSVIIPNSVTEIGYASFASNKLTSLTIPNSVTSIGTSAFEKNQLTSLVIPSNITNIGQGSFRWNKLESLIIPNSIKIIGSFSFMGNKLTSLTIPDSVITISYAAFTGNQLTTLNIPDSVKAISLYAFTGNKLTEVSVAQDTSMGDIAFDEGVRVIRRDGIVNKVHLINAIVSAKATSTVGKTAKSIKVLSDAITSAELLRDNTNATQAQVDVCIVVIHSAIAGLENSVADNEIIEFKDANLEKAVRREIKKTEGNILVSDVKYIKKIYLDKSQIVEISPLKYFSDLEDLSLGANNITDIKVLGTLTKLKKLSISHNLVTDIEILSKLINLEELYLDENKINNIDVLEDLTKLESLSLSRNQISDIGPIGQLTKLKRLNLGVNNITSIGELKNLIELDYLSLYENKITDISVLRNLTELKNLHIGGNSIKDISYLENLIKLEWLSLNKNQIIDINHLKNLINLKILDIRDNQILDYTPLIQFIDIDIRRSESATCIVSKTLEYTRLEITLNSLKLSDINNIKVNGKIVNYEYLDNYIMIVLPLVKVESVELDLKDGTRIKSLLGIRV